jgi:mono/diheme cytochrome c family protein
MKMLSRLMVATALAGVSALAHSQAPPAASRGQLLYSTHCISCHTAEMHWRNNRQARDWDSLKMLVRRWQTNAGLKWADTDIAEVARHLNDTIYHFPQTADQVSMALRRAPP